MVRTLLGGKWAVMATAVGAILCLCPMASQAQMGGMGGMGQSKGGRSQSDSPKSDSSSGTAAYQTGTPDPYNGQIFCPVTGAKLGLTQPPVPVQTKIGEQPPGFWGKLFGQKTKPGVVIYVCCPRCVDVVRANPELYLGEIIADKTCFTFNYAKAPAQRPQRVRSESTHKPSGASEESASHVQPPAPTPNQPHP